MGRQTRGVWARSYERAGRLVPPDARLLRSRSVVLRVGERVDWHTTGDREELLIGVHGRVDVEVRSPAVMAIRDADSVPCRRIALDAGRCLFLPCETWHRVVNRSGCRVHYLYVTTRTPSHRGLR